MAETAKLMSPNKKVLLPDMKAGCSLSSSITGKDVRLLKEKYPGVPVVSYVNTSAEVKAETDVCCTSANAVKIVKSLGVKKVIFLPDDYLAKYVASQTDVEIISWKGICMVHDQFNENEIKDIRNRLILPAGQIVDEDFSIPDPSNTLTSLSGNAVRIGISNYEYETRVNEKKRNIDLLKPEYLQQFLKDMRKIMKYSKSSQFINTRLVRTSNVRIKSP